MVGEGAGEVEVNVLFVLGQVLDLTQAVDMGMWQVTDRLAGQHRLVVGHHDFGQHPHRIGQGRRHLETVVAQLPVVAVGVVPVASRHAAIEGAAGDQLGADQHIPRAGRLALDKLLKHWRVEEMLDHQVAAATHDLVRDTHVVAAVGHGALEQAHEVGDAERVAVVSGVDADPHGGALWLGPARAGQENVRGAWPHTTADEAGLSAAISDPVNARQRAARVTRSVLNRD